MIRSLLINDELTSRSGKSTRWQVIDPVARDGYIKLFDRETHSEVYKPLDEIKTKIVSGELSVKRLDIPRISAAAQANPKLDEQIASALSYLRQIEQVRKKYRVSFSGAYDIARKEHNSSTDRTAEFPSRATLYRYFKAKRNDLPLLRGDMNKGNRTPRYDQRITGLICSAANGLYLKPGSRWSLHDLTEYVTHDAREQGWINPGQSVSLAFVQKTIFTNLSVDPEIDRMDPKDVAAAKSIAKNRIIANSPFERVEQDAVHLPFVVMTAHGLTSNVWLIHAIDCCTGKVVGWHMVIGSPSESDGLKCVASILFSKLPDFQRLGLTYDTDIYGAPHQLVYDNGAETKGQRMGKLLRLGIDVMHCKSRHAHEKPHIERLNRSLKEAVQVLPGCTRMNGKDGQRDPIKLKDKLMTEAELESWVVRWYYESWDNTVLKRHLRSDFHDVIKLGNTPAQRWNRMTLELGYPTPLPPSMSEWRMTLYEHEQRTLNRKTGITCRGFNFRGSELGYLIQKYGETLVNILIDPDDYRLIYVDEGAGLPLVPLIEEHATDTTPAYSFSQMHIALKEQSDAITEDPKKTKFRNDVHERSAESIGKSTKRKPKTAERNRIVADSVKKSKALQRAAEKPLNSGIQQSTSLTVPTLAAFSFDDVPAMPLLNRVSGKEQK